MRGSRSKGLRNRLLSRSHADPHLAVFVEFLFPDGGIGLDAIDRVLAGAKSLFPVRRRRRNHHRQLTGPERPHAMDDRRSAAWPLLRNLIADTCDHLLT